MKLNNKLLIMILGIMLYCIPNIVLAAPANPSFVDDNFYKCIIDELNSNKVNNISNRGYDYVVTEGELSQITKISYNHNTPSRNAIRNLTGLEKLTNLKELSLVYNEVTEINVSSLVNLETLKLDRNQITSIDLSHNAELKYLSINNNKISTIDLSNNKQLYYIHLGGNNLSSIDLSQNINLTDLYLYSNQLTAIDLSNNTKLKLLLIQNNNLTSLDVSMLSMLNNINAHYNKIKNLDLRNNKNLKTIVIGNNLIEELQIPNSVESLFAFGNPIKEYDFTSYENLRIIMHPNIEDEIPTVFLPLGRQYEVLDSFSAMDYSTTYDSSNQKVISFVKENSFKTLAEGNTLITVNTEVRPYKMNITVVKGTDYSDDKNNSTNNQPEDNDSIENPNTSSNKILLLIAIVPVLIGILSLYKMNDLSKK